MIVHNRIHSKTKSYNCDVCDKSWAYKSELIRHMQVHSGKKDFQYYVCGKYFARNTNLKKHLIIHTFNAKQFKCDVCDKHFTQKGSAPEPFSSGGTLF